MDGSRNRHKPDIIAGAKIVGSGDSDGWTSVDISLESGYISSVEPARKRNDGEIRNAGSSVFDASGLYVIPGLINAHAHLFSFGDIDNPDIVMHAADYEHDNHSLDGPFDALALSCASVELASGVTTVRCMGDFFESDIRLRNAVAEGKLQGPRIVCCGRPLTVAKGHGDGPIARKGSTPDEFVTCTQQALQHRPDFIKIFATGGVVDATQKGEPGRLKMTAEQIAAVCRTAHEHGLKVSAHAESTEGVKVCLQSGVDHIEHGAALSDECIELFLKTKAVLIQTLSPAVSLARFADDVHLNSTVQYNAKYLLDQMLKGLHQARCAGIPVALGNDASCAFVPHYAFWRELAYTTKLCGLSSLQTLRAATQGNAAIFQLADTGRIEPGATADMVFFEDDPLRDIRILSRPADVVCKGAFASRSFSHIESIDTRLDELI